MKRSNGICFLLSLMLMGLSFSLLIPHGSEAFVDQKEGVYNLSTAQSYASIQGAIDAANPGDTILIPTGIYYEKVVVNKAVSLIGENRENTILSGDSSGIGFRVVSDNVTIKKFTIKGFEHGIYVDKCINVSIEDVNLTGNYYGVRALHSNQIRVRNCFMLNSHGVVLDRSNGSLIENNVLKGYGPVSSGGDGVLLDGSCYNTIDGNVITFFRISLYIVDSDRNLVRNNILNGSNYGIQMRNSTNNTFYRNNIFDIRIDTVFFIYYRTNIWDNGNEGNYWGDYEKRYPNAQERDYTGIWDTPYYMNENNQDNYPLMIPTMPLTRVNIITYSLQIKIYSNSSIYINFNSIEKRLSFKATVPAGAIGFSNVSIPNNVLWGNFSVYMDGALLKKDVDYTQTSSDTCFIFYLTYSQGSHTINIIGTEAIPELLPTNTLLLTLLLILMLTLYIHKRNKN